jgi:hypothetical protein
MRVSLRTALSTGVVAGLWIAVSAAAVPLTYGVVVNESSQTIDARAGTYVDVSPDLLNQFPLTGFINGTSVTAPTPSSNVVVDTGLPNNWADGSNGITFSSLSYTSLLAPGLLNGFGLVSVPLNITGSAFQLVGFQAAVAEYNITLDAPFHSTLTPGLNPNEWLWAGTATITMSGILQPNVIIPSQPTIALDPVPFSQSGITVAVAGTFQNSPIGGSRVTFGFPQGALQDVTLGTPDIVQPVDLGGILPVTGLFTLNDLIVSDIALAAVFDNVTPIPEPSTAALVALGLVGIAIRRRR